LKTIRPVDTAAETEKAFLTGVGLNRKKANLPDEPLGELVRLVETAGAVVAGRMWQNRPSLDPAFCLGRGKVQELKKLANSAGANIIVFDNDLSPAQVRNLEKALDEKVVDRSEVILDIFAKHAKTTQSKLQVEIAQLEYEMPRLKNLWTHLDRAGGGIGTRGPGEQQLETDRRIAGRKLRDLRRKLDVIKDRQERVAQSRRDYFTVSLVGYTNAGKSTLLNVLTDANTLVEDKLFATLDTKTRTWNLAAKYKVLLSDTVGFIRDIPHHLIESFYATLAEARHADLILHVVDVSSPTAFSEVDTVETVLSEVGCGDKPVIAILNKIDLVKDQTGVVLMKNRFPGHVEASALKRFALDRVAESVLNVLRESMITARLSVNLAGSRAIAEIGKYAEVLDSRFGNERWDATVRIRRETLARIAGREQCVEVLEPVSFASEC